MIARILASLHDTSVEHREDGELRAFLSTKKSSSQHIAGKLWDSLHVEYNIYLSSESRAKRVDTKNAMAKAEFFIMILSKEYFQSAICVEELKIAIELQKKVGESAVISSLSSSSFFFFTFPLRGNVKKKKEEEEREETDCFRLSLFKISCLSPLITITSLHFSMH